MTTSTYRPAFQPAGAPDTRTVPPASRRTFPPFRTPVRGHAFAARPPDATSPRPGQRALLRREPEHPVDPLAVGVWVAGGGAAPWRIGYLDRAVAARIAPRLDGGHLHVDAHVDGWWPEPNGRWQRPVVRLVPRDTNGERGPGPRGSGEAPHGEPPRSVRRTVG